MHSLASLNVSSTETSFKMAPMICHKMVNDFWSKSSKFCVVRSFGFVQIYQLVVKIFIMELPIVFYFRFQC